MINSIVNTGFQPAVEVRDHAGGPVAPTAAVSTPAISQQSSATDTARLKVAVRKLNDYVQNVQRNLSFSVDKDSGQTVIKVYDVQTKEVIRQIPPDETLRLAAQLEERIANLFVQEKV
jgi:flagellar protein FlaG